MFQVLFAVWLLLWALFGLGLECFLNTFYVVTGDLMGVFNVAWMFENLIA